MRESDGLDNYDLRLVGTQLICLWFKMVCSYKRILALHKFLCENPGDNKGDPLRQHQVSLRKPMNRGPINGPLSGKISKHHLGIQSYRYRRKRKSGRVGTENTVPYMLSKTSSFETSPIQSVPKS